MIAFRWVFHPWSVALAIAGAALAILFLAWSHDPGPVVAGWLVMGLAAGFVISGSV